MSTLNAIPFRSTIFYTPAGVPAATGSVLTIGANGVSGFTTNLGSTTVSIGASTNQTYNNFSGGSFTTGWASTLTGLSAVTDAVMSQNGQYQLAVQNGSSTIRTSANSGLTWSSLTGANGLPTGTPIYNTISESATGQYVLAGTNASGLYLSNNATLASPTFTSIIVSPYAYLPFDNSVADTMGNSNPIATGSPAYVTGQVGTNAINLANTAGGTPSRYVIGTWSGSPNFTVSFWFNLQSLGAIQSLFSAYGVLVYLYVNASNVLIWSFPTGGGVNTTTITGSALSSNVWYNVSFIFQTAGLCSLYLNNSLVGSFTNVSGLGTRATANYALGTYDLPAYGQALNGYIDDFRIYNYATTLTNWTHTAVSATGQYMLAAARGGGLFQSSNYGATWTQVNAVLNGGAWNGLSISASGQYALATTNAATITPNLTGLVTNTWTTNGVAWVVSASSILNSVHAASNAFNNEISGGAVNRWATLGGTYNSGTGAYAGSVSTTIQGVGAILGEWIQLSSSVPLVLSSYTGSCGGSIAQFPKIYYLVGSNDGSTWFPIQFANITTTPFTTSYTACSTYLQVNFTGTQTLIAGQAGSVATTAYSTSTQAYIHFRMVIPNVNVSGGGIAEVNELYYNFVGGLAYTTNYGQTWLNNDFLSTAESFNALSGNGQYALTGTGQTAYLISNYLGGLSTGSYTIAPYNPANLSNLAYFPMNDAVGSTSAIDTMYGNSAAVAGTVTFGATGKAGTAATFGGSGHLSLHPSVYSTWNNLTTGSISCWVYPTNNSSLTGSVLFSKQSNGVSTVSELTIGRYANTTGTAGRVYFSMAHTLFNANSGSTTILALNTWYHIVVTFDGTNVRFYINGALDNTFATSWTLPNNASPTNITIGANTDGVTRFYPFTGTIDEFSLWNTALPLATIQSIYNGGNPVTPANIIMAACSQTGQYMVIVTQGTSNNVYYSINYGTSWTGLTVGSTAITSCAISADGSYITVSNATTVFTLNRNTQGFTVAVGNQAGLTNQAQNAIAIGNQAGQINQTSNSIILNASGSAVNPYTQGFYVAPIAQAFQSSALTFPLVGYGSDNQIVQAAHSFSNSQSVVYGEWIQYQLATASPITSYTLQARQQFQNRYPVSWVILGSNDATTWALLDTQTGTAGWGTYTLKSVTAPYTYYRMVFTQLSSVNVGYINISGWTLINGSPLFGPSANYTLVTSGLYNILQYNGVTVCTTTFSWSNTAPINSFGVAFDAGSGSSYPSGWLPTSDAYLKSINYFLGLYFIAGPSYEYNSSYIAVQGTSTTITTTMMGDTNMAGLLRLTGALDVAGTSQLNGVVPSFGQPDSSALPQNAYATFGQMWNVVTGLPTNVSWVGSGVSATGQYQTAIVRGTNNGNNFYYSSNYGQSWTLATGFLANGDYYYKLGMSGSGQYQLMGITAASSALYVSSNYGQTWSATSYTLSASAYGRASCISYNGQYQFNVQTGGSIAVSSNYGASFANSSAPTGSWHGICCSSSGQYVSAGIYGGSIYYSSNYGVTWTQSSSAVTSWHGICCSASGQYQIAVANSNGTIYYSNNYGINWSQSNAPIATWIDTACTTSGQYAIAITSGGYIYYSTNYGVTWVQSGSPSASWQSCAISQNGLYSLAVVIGTSAVYSSQLGNVGLVTNGMVKVATQDSGAGISRVFSFVNTNGYGIYANSSSIGSRGNTLDWYSYDFNLATITTRPVLTMRPEGNVGIGVTAPVGKLSVLLDGLGAAGGGGGWNSSYALFGPGANSADGSCVAITYNTAANEGGLISISPNVAWRNMKYSAYQHIFYANGNATPGFSIDLARTIFFGGYNVTGTLTIVNAGTGQVGLSSDRRIKENIIYKTDTQQGLTSIVNLKPATFNFIGSSDSHLGFIAQDLEQEIPMAVDGKKYEWQWETEDGKPKFDTNGDIVYKLDDNGNKIIRPRGVSDRAIIATQTLAIQELAKKATSQAETIQTHETIIASLQSQNAALQARMDALEARLAA